MAGGLISGVLAVSTTGRDLPAWQQFTVVSVFGFPGSSLGFGLGTSIFGWKSDAKEKVRQARLNQ